MCKDIRENISREEIDYTYLAVNSKNLKVGVIGGGKAGLIKAKGFINRGSFVQVLSREFLDDFYSLKDISLIKEEYNCNFIKDKHLIIIATNDKMLNLKIKNDCEENFKLYIFTEDYKESMVITPVQRSLDNITFALNTKSANPKGALLISNKFLKVAKEYDEFILYSSKLRGNTKEIKEYKEEIIEFICNDDFKFICEKGKDKLVLQMFFEKEVLDKMFKNL